MPASVDNQGLSTGGPLDRVGVAFLAQPLTASRCTRSPFRSSMSVAWPPDATGPNKRRLTPSGDTCHCPPAEKKLRCGRS